MRKIFLFFFILMIYSGVSTQTYSQNKDKEQAVDSIKPEILLDAVIHDSQYQKLLSDIDNINFYKNFEDDEGKKITVYYFIEGKIDSNFTTKYSVELFRKKNRSLRKHFDLVVFSNYKIIKGTSDSHVSLLTFSIDSTSFKDSTNIKLYNKFLSRKWYRRDRVLNIYIDSLLPNMREFSNRVFLEDILEGGTRKSGKVVTTNEEDDESGEGFLPKDFTDLINTIALVLTLLGLGIGFFIGKRRSRSKRNN